MSNGPFTGKVDFLDSNGNAIVTISPDAFDYAVRLNLVGNASFMGWLILGGATLGGPSADGSASLRDANGTEVIALDVAKGEIRLGNVNKDGELVIRNKDVEERIQLTSGGGPVGPHTTVYLNGAYGLMRLGGDGTDGNLVVRDRAGQNALHLDGKPASLNVGASGNPGEIVLWNGEAKRVFEVIGKNAVVFVGGHDADGTLSVQNAENKATIVLQGSKGDIVLSNADCAEDFDVGSPESVEPGTVMVLDQEGVLRPSAEAYDRKVAGIISGASGCKPGIVLDRKESPHCRMPLALAGKAYCKVDASHDAVEVGDLLTTSPTPGHAMKASDPVRAFGAVIGKALSPLREGRGLIPVLVALQ